jgi:hypothetical protein
MIDPRRGFAGKAEEMLTGVWLHSFGYRVEPPTTWNNHYDLKANGKRIEVKAATLKFDRYSRPKWHVRNYKFGDCLEEIDLYIFRLEVMLGEDIYLVIPKTVFPFPTFKAHVRLRDLRPGGRFHEYINNLEVLEAA